MFSLSNDLTKLGFVSALLFILVSFMLLFLLWPKLPPQMPLLYSHPWGEEQLAGPALLFLLPGSSLGILAVNFLLANFFSEEKLLLKILGLGSALAAFLGLFTQARILILSL